MGLKKDIRDVKKAFKQGRENRQRINAGKKPLTDAERSKRKIRAGRAQEASFKSTLPIFKAGSSFGRK